MRINVKKCAKQVDRLLKEKRLEEAFKLILTFYVENYPTGEWNIKQIFHGNPLDIYEGLNKRFLSLGSIKDMGGLEAARNHLREKITAIQNTIKPGPVREEINLILDRISPRHPGELKYKRGEIKKRYVEDLAEIAEQQANVGCIKEAKETLSYARLIANTISLYDYVSYVNGQGWMTTWGDPQREADIDEKRALEAAKKASVHVDLIEILLEVCPEHCGNVSLSFVEASINSGDVKDAIHVLENLGLYYRDVMKTVCEIVGQIDDTDNIRKRTVINYALNKRSESPKHLPDADMLLAALNLIVRSMDDHKSLENWALTIQAAESRKR